jgi:hypothetical protein
MQKAKLTPTDYSKYQQTGNISIDLISQTIGYHKAIFVPLSTIYLSHGRWMLFVEGMRVLHHIKGLDFDHHSEFTFEGVTIKEGSRFQMEPMKYEYKVKQGRKAALKN